MISETAMRVDDFHHEQIAFGTKRSYVLTFGPGAEECVPLNLVKGRLPGPTLLIMAGVHGDEYEGIQTVIKLFRTLSVDEVHGTVMLIPVANVSAYRAGTRTSGMDGGNLARAFPGDRNGSYTSRLAWHLGKTFISKTDFLLDLHSGGTHYAMPLMVGYDGNRMSDAGRRSRAAAESLGIPVLWEHQETGPGRTISLAASLDIPWLYLEGYGGKRILPAEQEYYEGGVHRLLVHLGILPGNTGVVPFALPRARRRVKGDGDLDRASCAPADGFFVARVRLLDRVDRGETIGVIYDWHGNELWRAAARTSGIVMMLRGTPVVTAGDGLFLVAESA